MRFGVEMQVTELVFVEIEVGAVHDALVAELPVRACVHAAPASHRLGHALRGRIGEYGRGCLATFGG